MTQSEAKDFWPLIKAWAEGATLQTMSDGVWEDTHGGVAFTWHVENYRIKPEPKLRPWKPSEVPCGFIAREKDVSKRDAEWAAPISVTGRGVLFAGDITGLSQFSFDEMLDHLEHSTDGGKTWKPCGIEE